MAYLYDFNEFINSSPCSVEFICLKHGLRKVVQIDLSSDEEFKELRRYVSKFGWSIKRPDYKFDLNLFKQGKVSLLDISDKKKGLFHCYIYNDKEKFNKSRMCEISNDEYLGELMGYPKCCIKNYMSKRDNQENILDQMGIKKDTTFCSLINPFVKFITNAYLINHFPCSLKCNESIELAKKIASILRLNYPKLYQKAFILSNMPVLVFKDDYPYDLREEINILFLKELRKDYFRIIQTTIKQNSKLDYIFRNINEVEISDKKIRLFNNNKFIAEYKRDALNAFFLKPY